MTAPHPRRPTPEETIRFVRLGIQRLLALVMLLIVTPLSMGIAYFSAPPEAPTWLGWVLAALPLMLGLLLFRYLVRASTEDEPKPWRPALRVAITTFIVCGGTLAVLVVFPRDHWSIGAIASACASCFGVALAGLMVAWLRSGYRT